MLRHVGLAVIAVCLATPIVFAQSERLPRIVWVLIGTPESSRGAVEAFLAGLRDEGLVEGRSVIVERRFAEGRPERYAELFAELGRTPVDVFVAAGFQGIAAARDASAGRTPVVGYFCGNDVEQMVASFARPGGNVTGVSCLSAELAGKRVDLLRDVLPNLRRIGFLYNPTIPGKDKELDETVVAAKRHRIAVVPAPVSSREGLPEVFALLRRNAVEALVVSEDLFTFGNRNEIMALVVKERLADISAYREFVEAGGLLSYGASLVERSRQFGRYAGRVARGTKPADLPIDQPTRFELVINLPAARAMGKPVPQSILQRANDVIR